MYIFIDSKIKSQNSIKKISAIGFFSASYSNFDFNIFEIVRKLEDIWFSIAVIKEIITIYFSHLQSLLLIFFAKTFLVCLR